MNRLTKRFIVIAALMLVALFSMVTVSLPKGSASAVRQPAASPLFQQVAQCPPLTTINGTLGSGSPDYPATSGQQTGRILNGLANLDCGDSNACSLGLTTTGSRAFDAYTFNNPGSATACVTVTLTLSVCQGVQFSARVGSFDPANPCANYVGDAGAGLSGPTTKSFSFNVPAGQNFVVVVNENDPGGAVGCTYTLTISGLACQAAPCPPTTAINGTLGSGSPDFPATSGQQTGRILNGLANLDCGDSNACSLGLTTTGSRAFDAYTFNNPGSATACVTVTLTLSVCQGVQFSARVGSFDPANPCANYVGDGGAGFSGPTTKSFSFNVPTGQNFVVVVNENDPGDATGCAYTLTISGITCGGGQACTLTCPSNVNQPNDPGQCGAVVSFSAPTTSGDCGAVTCNPASGSFFPVGTTTVTCTPTTGSNCTFTVTIQDTQAPAITCPANIVKSNDLNQCGAVVTYTTPTPTDVCGGATASCSPLSGSFFPVGVTTVTCTASDTSPDSPNATCTFTVTVTDTQPPTITCPAKITTTTATISSPCVAVSFAPTASDFCPGVTKVCNPPSTSCFPVGTTTVTCTATDASGNTASCSFTVTVFNVCLQDDSNPSTVFLGNTITGAYRFCCGGTVFTGVAQVTKRANTVTFQHNPPDRRVAATIDGGTFKGSASLQSPPGTTRCTIQDRDTRNNGCVCQ